MIHRRFLFFLLLYVYAHSSAAQVDTLSLYNPSASFGVLDLRLAKSSTQYYFLNEGETFSFRKSNGVSTRTYLDMTAWDSSPYIEGNLREKNGTTDSFIMNYRLLKPQAYDQKFPDGYPLVILLHGLLERGNCAEGKCYHGGRGYSPAVNNPAAPSVIDSELLNNDYNLVHGGSNYLEAWNLNGARLPDDPNLPPRAFPGFVVVPQNLNGWDDLAVEDAIRIVRLLVKKYNIDEDRIYINGVSHGGHGAYKAMVRAPWLFTAGILFSAADDAGTISQNLAERISGIPLWLFQGGKDIKPTRAQTERYVQQFRTKGASVRYTLYSELGHGTWNKAFAEPDFFSWMLRHKKNDVHVFADNPVLCATSNVGTPLRMPAGFFGYEWEHNGRVVSTEAMYVATEQGNYRGRFLRRNSSIDVWSDWSAAVNVVQKDPGSPSLKLTGTRFLPDLNGSDTLALTVDGEYDIYNWFREQGRLKFEDSVSSVTIRSQSGDGKYYIRAAKFDKCFTRPSPPQQVYFGDRAPLVVKAPSELSVVTVSPSQTQVNWIDNSENENGFELWRRRKISDEHFESWELALIASANTTQTVDNGLVPSSYYEYRIRAINDLARSPYHPALTDAASNVVTDADTELPSAPELLSATQTGISSLVLAWSRSTDNSSIKRYRIVRNGEIIETQTSDTVAIINAVEVNTLYKFQVVAVDAGDNNSEASNEIEINTVVNGLFYQHSTGAWENLESIDWSLAEFTGTVPRLTLSPKTQQDFFNFRFQGFLRIVKEGIYQFRISSDDGSMLKIDSLLVMNDGIHTMTTTTSPIQLLESGHHSIEVQFFDYDRSDSLLVEYKGPDSGNQWVNIPDEAFTSNVITDVADAVSAEVDPTIFPNPTTPENINIRIPDASSDANISVLNSSGQLISTIDVRSDEFADGYRMQEMERLLPGIYFVMIRQQKINKNIKLIIK